MTASPAGGGEHTDDSEPLALSLFELDDPPPPEPPVEAPPRDASPPEPLASAADEPTETPTEASPERAPESPESADVSAVSVPEVAPAAPPGVSAVSAVSVPEVAPAAPPGVPAESGESAEPMPEAPAGAPSAGASAGDDPPLGNLVEAIAGQPAAVGRLLAALESPLPSYLFVGPAGAGLRSAACRFAGELLAARSPAPQRERRLALAEQHPDLLFFDRVGAAMTADQARDAVRAAASAPAVGEMKVLVVPEVDRAAQIAPILLKSVEEPPPSTVFVLLAEEINRAMETLASRCVRVDFEAYDVADLRSLLVEEGVPQARAEFAASAAGGSIERARLLAADDDAAARVDTWRSLRGSLDGTASAAAAAADTALEAAEQAAAPLEARHETERADADEQAELYGTNAGRSTLDERHRRELRRVRTDELTMGLAALSAQVRDETSRGTTTAAEAAKNLTAIGEAARALRLNANQRLALLCMFIQLGRPAR